MDNILDRLGLYDFFGLLLPGMFFIVVLDLINFPLIKSFTYFESDVLNGIEFVLVGYICGTIIQEIASFLDENTKQIRLNAIREYIYDEKFSKLERKEIEKLVKKLSQKEENNQPTEDEYYNTFFKCKEYLEEKEKMKKANKLDAIFAMSRDFIICNFLLSILTLITIVENNLSTFYDWAFLFSLIISIFIFYNRAKRYAKMRVRIIFRKYLMCKEQEN